MKTIEEINQIRKEKRAELDLRVNTKSDTREKHILVCHGTGCTSSKSPEILKRFREILIYIGRPDAANLSKQDVINTFVWKISELAKELACESKDLLGYLQEKGIETAKRSTSSIEDAEADQVRKHFGKAAGKTLEKKEEKAAVSEEVKTAEHNTETGAEQPQKKNINAVCALPDCSIPLKLRIRKTATRIIAIILESSLTMLIPSCSIRILK